MKTANVYDIERALQQPITPQQRQTAAANNPVAALLAQRLDGVEGSLRTKLQTPPPPQGTVMNQYYQWPQQQPEMGLAQPGLEEMAQQYAAGGLVAFADGGPVLDVDDSYGYGAYAQGGLATMLPMGYAGEEDMPVFNGYAGGGGVLKSVFPATFDEDEYDEGEGENFGDVGSGVYGLSEKDVERDKRQKDVANRVVEAEAMQRYSAGPGDIIGKGVEGAKKVGSALMDMAFIKDPAWEARQAEKKTQAADYYKTTTPPPSRSKPAEQGIAAVPTEEPGLLDRLRSVLPQNTESGEDRKYKQQQEDRTKEQEARVAEKEKTSKARKASVSVPSANPVRTAEGPGVSVLSPQAWGGGPLGSTAGYEPSTEMAEAPASEQESNVNLNPNNNATAAAIVNSPLSADQQIAAIEKYFQTDTSEAMRIKGEMEKESAHAGNVGIMAVLANALGMGLGTYGTGAARWGAGLMGAAQGFMGEQKAADARQEKINELGLKVKEMEREGPRKSAEYILKARQAAEERKQKLADQLAIEKVKGGYREQVANIGAGASRYSADQRAAEAKRKAEAKGMTQPQYAHILAEAEQGAAAYIKANYTDQGKQTPPGAYDQVRQRLIQERLAQVGSVPQTNMGMAGVTPDLVVGSRTSRGMFDPNRGFTAYQ